MTDWSQIAKEAATTTDATFKNQISSLTRLNESEIEDLINNTGIKKTDLALVLKEVNDATKSNVAKANSIKNISQGVDLLVAIAAKLV